MIEDRLVRIRDTRIWDVEIARICDYARKRRSGGRFRTYQVDFDLSRTGAAWKIARNRAQTDFLRGRGLAHSDAAVATCLMHARTRVDQVQQVAIADEILQNLPRGWVDIK
jgi:hypothetical protein